MMTYLEYIIKMQSIAKIGLTFNNDPYALENYKLIEDLSKEMLEKYTDSNIEEDNYFIRNIYPTPNVSTRVLVIKDDKILMVKEIKTQDYSLPGGWCDVFDNIRKNAVDEAKQESGFDIVVDKVLAIFNRQTYQKIKSSVSEYSIYFSASIISGKASVSHETDDVDFFDIDNLPKLSYKNTHEEINIAYDVYINNKETYFD